MTYRPHPYMDLLNEETYLIDEVWEVLDPGHCDQCYAWSIGELAWWKDSDTIEGQAQIRDIIRHYHVKDATASITTKEEEHAQQTTA